MSHMGDWLERQQRDVQPQVNKGLMAEDVHQTLKIFLEHIVVDNHADSRARYAHVRELFRSGASLSVAAVRRWDGHTRNACYFLINRAQIHLEQCRPPSALMPDHDLLEGCSPGRLGKALQAWIAEQG